MKPKTPTPQISNETSPADTTTQQTKGKLITRKSILIIGAVIGFVIILLVIAAVLITSPQTETSPDVTEETEVTVEPTVEEEVEEETTETVEVIPEVETEEEKDINATTPNSIFTVTAINPNTNKQEEGILFTDTKGKSILTFGFSTSLSNLGRIENPDLSEIVITKHLATLETDNEEVLEFRSHYFSEDENLSYFEFISAETYSNRIFQIDSDTGTNKEIWSKGLNTGLQPYGEKKGEAWIVDLLNEKYLVLSIPDCYACGPGPGSMDGFVVINTQTLNEIFLGEHGDISIDEDLGKIYTHEYELVEEECEIGYGCDTGTLERAYLTGPIVEFDLP